MTITFQPLEEYRKSLQNFDWLFDFSDDHAFWAKSKIEYDRLWEQARISDDHRQVWDEEQARRKAAFEKREAEYRARVLRANNEIND
jgi:hypothetical protein